VGWKTSTFFIQRLQTFFFIFVTFFITFLTFFIFFSGTFILHLWFPIHRLFVTLGSRQVGLASPMWLKVTSDFVGPVMTAGLCAQRLQTRRTWRWTMMMISCHLGAGDRIQTKHCMVCNRFVSGNAVYQRQPISNSLPDSENRLMGMFNSNPAIVFPS